MGPSAEVVAAIGSKLEAKRRMQRAGVPQLPSRELRDGVSPAELARLAGELGLPIVVKASAGGGGRGMRVVHSATELAEAVASTRREALSAFGDDTVYLERYLEAARHIEVQIFGDAHGRVIHLYERECSIQRRHRRSRRGIAERRVDPRVERDNPSGRSRRRRSDWLPQRRNRRIPAHSRRRFSWK